MKKRNYFWIVMMGLFLLCSCGKEVQTEDGAQRVSAAPTADASLTAEVSPTALPTATVSPTPTPTLAPTPTPTPVPGWQVVSTNSQEADNQYVLDGVFFPSSDQNCVINVNGNVLVLQYDYEDELVYAELIDINTETTQIAELLPIGGNYILNWGELDQGCFYLLDGEGVYHVYDSNLTEIASFSQESFDYAWGELSQDGNYIYYCDEEGNLHRTGRDGKTELLMQNSGENLLTVNGVLENGNYLVTSYYLFSEDESENSWYTQIIDTTTWEVTATLKGMCTIYSQAGRNECVISNIYPYNSLSVCSFDESMGLSEEVFSVALNGAGGSAADKIYVDWERGVCIEVECYKGLQQDTYWEATAYDITDGSIAASTVIRDSNENYEPICTLLSEVGAMCFYTNSNGLVLWDYTDTDVEDSWTFGKYGYVSQKTAAQIAKLEEKYNIYIYAGGETAVSTFDYDFELCREEAKILNALPELEEVFSLYPEGFFEQLKCNGVKTLGVYLVGEITRKDAYGVDYPIAFATSNGYEQALVVNINVVYNMKETLIHEISHWIDTKITSAQSQGLCTDFFDEYISFAPEDFEYVYSYVDYNYNYDYIYSYEKFSDGQMDQVYYIDDYAQTFPGEDRARCFEQLMGDKEQAEIYFQSPHLCAKLDYFFAAIREAFDTSGWPEKTAWEQRLSEVRGD